MFKLLSALSQIHTSGIIHRDVKPDNFLFWTDAKCSSVDGMLIDFGLAQDAPPQDGRKSSRPHVSLAALCDGSHAAALLRSSRRPRSAAEALVQDSSQSRHSSIQRSPHTHPATTAASKRRASPGGASSRWATTQGGRLEHPPLIDGSWGGRFPSMATVQTAVDAEFERHDREAARSSNGVPVAAQTAPRAGTASFRAPEVLLRVPHQSTAIDLWSAGVILGSLLTRRHPFFPYEDLKTSLTAVAGLLGWPRLLASALRMSKAREARPVVQCTSRAQAPALVHPLRRQVYRNTVALLHERWPGAGTPRNEHTDPPSPPPPKAQGSKCAKTSEDGTATATSSGQAAGTGAPAMPLCTPPAAHTPAFAAFNMCSEFMLCSYVSPCVCVPSAPPPHTPLFVRRAHLHDCSAGGPGTSQLEEALYMCLRLLDPDPFTRLSAAEALQLPFFDSIWQQQRTKEAAGSRAQGGAGGGAPLSEEAARLATEVDPFAAALLCKSRLVGVDELPAVSQPPMTPPPSTKRRGGAVSALASSPGSDAGSTAEPKATRGRLRRQRSRATEPAAAAGESAPPAAAPSTPPRSRGVKRPLKSKAQPTGSAGSKSAKRTSSANTSPSASSATQHSTALGGRASIASPTSTGVRRSRRLVPEKEN